MRPAPPDWVAAFGIGAGREPAELHAGGCHMTGPAGMLSTGTKPAACSAPACAHVATASPTYSCTSST
jgi:hypothetical protein